MKTKVTLVKVALPDGSGYNWINIRTAQGDFKRRFMERLLREEVVVAQPAVVALLGEVLEENKRLRKEVNIQKRRVEIRDDLLDENGIVPNYYGA